MKTTKQYKAELIEKLDLIDIEEKRFDDSGKVVEIWLETDNNSNEYLKQVVMDRNAYQPGAIVVARLSCYGYGGDYDFSYYEGGWCKRELTKDGEKTGKYIITDKYSEDYGRVVSEIELIMICLDEDDFAEDMDVLENEILSQWDDLEYSEY